jgi:anti-sigma regulatory factor (Ser/Thr protein kinase)
MSVDMSVERPGLAHRCCVCASDDEYLAAAVPFIEAGLVRDDPVLATVPRANSALLRRALGARAGWIDYTEPVAFGHRPPERLAALDRYWRQNAPRVAGGRLRVLCEPVWAGRSPREIAAWTYLESHVNVLFGAADVSVLCLYDTRVVPAGIVAECRRTHPELVRGGRVRPSEHYVHPTVYSTGPLEPGSAPVPVDPMGGPFTASDLVSVRDEALAYARRRGVSRARALDLVFAVNEATANAVLHGSGRGSVWFWAEDDELICEVTDDSGDGGAAIGPFAGCPPPRDECGRGLWLVRQLCDRVHIGVANGRTVVRMHLAIH